MKKNNATIKSIKKLLRRYSMFSKAVQYARVAEDLKISTRWVRYIENGEKEPSKHLAELIKIIAQ